MHCWILNINVIWWCLKIVYQYLSKKSGQNGYNHLLVFLSVQNTAFCWKATLMCRNSKNRFKEDKKKILLVLSLSKLTMNWRDLQPDGADSETAFGIHGFCKDTIWLIISIQFSSFYHRECASHMQLILIVYLKR